MAYNTIKSELLTADGGSWEQMARELLAAAALQKRVVRLAFFASCTDNATYLVRRNLLEQLAETYFNSPRPVLSFIAQKPLTGKLVLEVHSLKVVDANVLIREMPTSFGHYLRIESANYLEIVAGGLCAESLDIPIYLQSQQTFAKIQQILCSEQMEWGNVVRQWNYLERITEWTDDNQRYQDFNEVRAQFYASSQWLHGYPAATGIGVQAGGVQVDFNAVKGDVNVAALDNDWQRAAHVYSDEVLISNCVEKCTPKFERGKLLSDSMQGLIYISGTAAIRGEESVAEDILSQTHITMENILHLIEVENRISNIELLRVYLKKEEDLASAQKVMKKLCPSIPTAYLYADVCRDELLIEIEGVATIR